MSIKKIVGMTIIVIMGFLFLSKQQKSELSAIKKLKVTTSFYPLAYLAERIGGEFVIVTNLTPPGAEPHDFEPNTRDTAQLETQDIILLNGGGLEGYEKKLKVESQKSKVQVLFVGEGLMNINNDPHVWLDPVLYKKEVEIVTVALMRKDKAHEKELKAKSEKLKAELEELDTEFKQGLQNCAQRNIITSHSAFTYLAKRYNFHQISLSGLSPEQEPSSQTLVKVATFARENKIGYIFFEELVSPVIAETIAREVNAQTLVLNPLEGLTKKDILQGKTYISIQRENLKNLQKALECKRYD